jgi:hypothetical protein
MSEGGGGIFCLGLRKKRTSQIQPSATASSQQAALIEKPEQVHAKFLAMLDAMERPAAAGSDEEAGAKERQCRKSDLSRSSSSGISISVRQEEVF